MQRLDMNKVADRLSQRARTITASLADFRVVTPSMARVVMAFNTVDARREDLYDAVCAAFKNAARPISGSFREVSSFGRPAMVGYIALNREVKPYEESTAKGMRVLASNMLMDTQDDSLWDVRTDASGNKLLCRQSNTDLSELLVTARVRQQAPKLPSIRAGVDRGNFVSFVDPKTESLRFGYVLADAVDVTPAPASGVDIDTTDGVEIVELRMTGADDNLESDELRGEQADADDTFVVPASMVIEAAYLNGTDAHEEVAAPANSQSKDAMKDYYKRMFSYSPEYYAELVKIIDQHAGI